MYNQSDIAKAREIIDKSSDILLLLHDRPTHDGVGSTLALMLMLESLNKKVHCACADPMTVEFSGYIGVDKFQTALKNKNFIISLDYREGSIEKVSYNIENNLFNLVIEPRPGFDDFSSDKVKFSSTGAVFDAVIIIDTIHPGGVKRVFDMESMNADKKIPVINIDRHANNGNFGSVNIINPTSATTAEIVGKIVKDFGWTMNQDIATNLLNAVISGTNNFQSPLVGADTFEMTAVLMREGAKRFTARIEKQQEKPVNGQSDKPEIKNPPDDWLKPKIFKSTAPVS